MKKISCSCGNDKFLQEVIYNVIEEINLEQDDRDYDMISLDMIKTNSTERLSNFKCSICNKNYFFVKDKDGILLFKEG